MNYKPYLLKVVLIASVILLIYLADLLGVEIPLEIKAIIWSLIGS